MGKKEWKKAWKYARAWKAGRHIHNAALTTYYREKASKAELRLLLKAKAMWEIRKTYGQKQRRPRHVYLLHVMFQDNPDIAQLWCKQIAYRSPFTSGAAGLRYSRNRGDSVNTHGMFGANYTGD